MLPAPYRHWQDAARRLLEPLAALMQAGRADLPLTGPASDHDAQADRLESFARPLLLAAHWLQSAPRPEDAALREKISSWFRAGLVLGTDPAHPQYWGPDANYHQHHVEIGLLAIALQIAPAELWEPLTPARRDQVARWLGTARGNGIVNNNHYFMGVHILEFLLKHGYGRPADRPIVDEFLARLELMHRGGGWFEDGINQAYDHYNAYAFHFYGLWWARLHGARDPARAQRWRDWARSFVRDYEHFFAASGEHPAFGRSITYRFNCLNVFGLALAENCTDLPPGRLRRLCTRNLDFFLSKPITQPQGCLAIGWTDRFEPLMESYSCAASPYWCAKGFAPLLLPPEHPFWSAPEEPLAAERGDHAHVIRPAGLVVRSTGGEVEILNAGSQISNLNLRYGAWKWSKTAYRTGTGFTLAFPNQTNWSPDSALTLRLDDGRVFGRHSTVAVEMDEAHVFYSTNLGFKTGQVNCGVETGIWWKAGWILQVHRYECRSPGVLRVGGYALPLTEPRGVRGGPGPVLAAWSPAGAGTLLQPLHGFTATAWDERLDENTPRAHIAAPYHVTPIAATGRVGSPAGEHGFLAALAWTGADRPAAAPWTVISAPAGEWHLRHPALGDWKINHWSLPALT
ncbi:MAG: DUF2264 domain-containing protein [Verrucomicrobiota bacterium]